MNIKILLSIALVVSCVTASVKQLPKMSRAEREAAEYEATGGMVVYPGSQQGRLVVVNAQSRAKREWLEECAAWLAKERRIVVSVESGEFSFPYPAIAGNASLFVVDNTNLPPLLLAPESRWCMVNVAPLGTGNGEKAAFFEARVRKELVRGVSLLSGAQDSNYPRALVGCVTKPEDLDEFMDLRLPVDVLARFTPYLKGYGITPERSATYRKACREGWAPPPTNDVQKAIWTKVHQIPDKPLTIEFDGKKDK